MSQYLLIIDQTNIFFNYFKKKFVDRIIIESFTVDEYTDEEIEKSLTKGYYLIV